MTEIRTVVVDDHPVFRLGMAALLDSLAGIAVVGDAGDAASARDVVSTHQPDVVLMDLHLGDDSGIETTREIMRHHPGVAVLVITMQEDDESVVAAIRAGARGYLLKGASPEEVERAIRAVANGEVILGPRVAARAMAAVTAGRTAARVPFPELTDREREVLDLVARGYDNTTIARRLVLSPKTVRNHVTNVLSKIGAADRSSAIVTAREGGLGLD
jgi:DNA-binding NarL/FixJ family response regulator